MLPRTTEPTHGEWLHGRLADLWRWPLNYEGHSRSDRVLHRALVAILRQRVHRIDGIERIADVDGPFIVAANHSCRRDAVYLPALLMMARHGRPVHFLADWNFKLIPGVAALYRKAGAICVGNKSARPRVLNGLKSRLAGNISALNAARRVLSAGGAIALFPEGTTNRDPDRLLKGRHGCARLSLEHGVPVFPVGITYPRHPDTGRKPLAAAVAIDIGLPLTPPGNTGAGIGLAEVREWHAQIMQHISRQCGKSWPAGNCTRHPTPRHQP